MAEARAQTIIDEGVPSEETLRELLILCWHSSQIADSLFLSHANCTRFLVQLAQIAIDEKDYQGDAPPAAAYYLEKLPPPVLKGVADILLRGFPVEECGHNNSLAVAIALSGIEGGRAKVQGAYENDFLNTDSYEKAMAIYAEHSQPCHCAQVRSVKRELEMRMAEAHARVAQELDTARRVGTAEVWRCALKRENPMQRAIVDQWVIQ